MLHQNRNPFLQPSYLQDEQPRRSHSLREPRGRNSTRISRENSRSCSSDAFPSPLAQIKHEHKVAHRAPHLRKGNATPKDSIDSLDGSFLGGGLYHHEGPYDATLASRQIPGRAPVDAVKYSNAMALAATPRANIIDSLTRKVPLQGVGLVPPGMMGPGGQYFDYEEDDIERSEGNLGRWPGVKYLDTDIKGKGEPCFSVEEQEKAEKAQRKLQRGNVPKTGAELQMLNVDGHSVTRRRAVSDVPQFPYRLSPADGSNSSGTGVFGGLKKKLSFRKSRQ